LNKKIEKIKKKNDIFKDEINDLIKEQNDQLDTMKELSSKINDIIILIEKIAKKEGK